MSVKLVLTAMDAGLAKAWSSFCEDLDCVTVHRGSILDVECDAVVSPANSYGFMDGGIDALYVDEVWHRGSGPVTRRDPVSAPRRVACGKRRRRGDRPCASAISHCRTNHARADGPRTRHDQSISCNARGSPTDPARRVFGRAVIRAADLGTYSSGRVPRNGNWRGTGPSRDQRAPSPHRDRRTPARWISSTNLVGGGQRAASTAVHRPPNETAILTRPAAAVDLRLAR